MKNKRISMLKRNIQNKSGISLIMLSVTVVVMIILASTTIVSYNNIITDTLKKDFANEIYTIQKLVEHYEFLNNEYPVQNEYVLDINDIDEDFRFQFNKENITNDKLKLFTIDLVKCDVEQTKRGNSINDKDKYVVSKDTGIVYYIDGVVIDNMRYYTLTKDLRNEIGL